MFRSHLYPDSLPRSRAFSARVNGVDLQVLSHTAADFTSLEIDGPVELELTLPTEAPDPIVRPLNEKITASRQGTFWKIEIPGPVMLQVETAGMPLLYVYALPPAEPAPTGRKVKLFAASKIHETGEITLGDSEVCWLEPGAIVRGNIVVRQASGVQIGGYGVLDGRGWQQGGERRKAILLDRCRSSIIRDILMLGPCGWMLCLGGCQDVTVSGLRQLAVELGTDGIDVVGSRDINILGCCLHNGDDNIAIKAFTVDALVRWDEPVSNIRVSGCRFYNINGGSAMEIGYETRTDRISDIVFQNIDVMAVHQFGSVFGIHNGDRATVENILWQDVRVEHHYDKLVDFRTLVSRWNHDQQRGHIRNITLRHIRVHSSIYNPGYTLSVISGIDADHAVSDVRFEDFKLGGRRVSNADQLDLVTRHAERIVFA
jgi:hypothetical protein